MLCVSIRLGCVDHRCHSAHKSSAADSLLAERGRIDSSHQMTDDILEYAICYLAQSVFLISPYTVKPTRLAPNSPGNEGPLRVSIPEWQGLLVSFSIISMTFSQPTDFVDTMPGINNLLSMIKSRRRRDSIIVGCLIGLCIIFLLSYMSR
jgi:Golgi SNAP receptor complex protein 1